MLGAVFIFLRVFFLNIKKIFHIKYSNYWYQNIFWYQKIIFIFSKIQFSDIKNSKLLILERVFFHSRKSIFDIKSWPSFNDIKISSFFIIKKIIFWYKELHDIKKYLGILDVKNHFIFRYQKIYFVDKPKKKLTVNLMTVPCDATFIFLPGICCGSVILQFMMVAYDNIL